MVEVEDRGEEEEIGGARDEVEVALLRELLVAGTVPPEPAAARANFTGDFGA